MTVGRWLVTVHPDQMAAVRAALAGVDLLPLLECRDDGAARLEVATEGSSFDLLFHHHALRSVPGVRAVDLVSTREAD